MNNMRKIVILALCAVFAFGMAGCATSSAPADSPADDVAVEEPAAVVEETPAVVEEPTPAAEETPAPTEEMPEPAEEAAATDVDEEEASAVLEETSGVETIFEKMKFTNVHQHAVYHNTNSGDMEFDTYYFKNDDGLVSVLWTGSDGNTLYVNEDRAVSKQEDGTVTVVARSGDDQFKENYLSMITGALFYDRDPNQSIIDSHIEGGMRTITIQTPVAQSIPAESLKSLWGIEEGTLKTIFVIDMEAQKFVSCNQYIVGEDGRETEIYTSTFEYDVEFELTADLKDVE